VVVASGHDAHVAELVEGEVVGANTKADVYFIPFDLETKLHKIWELKVDKLKLKVCWLVSHMIFSFFNDKHLLVPKYSGVSSLTVLCPFYILDPILKSDAPPLYILDPVL
jgi:hypothetical protein